MKVINIRKMQYKIYVKCRTVIILNCLVILKLNNLLNICMYMYYIYCVFVVHNCV